MYLWPLSEQGEKGLTISMDTLEKGSETTEIDFIGTRQKPALADTFFCKHDMICKTFYVISYTRPKMILKYFKTSLPMKEMTTS